MTLQVPVAVQLEGRDEALRRALSMDEKTLEVGLTFDTRPLRFAVDPEFDLFRRLDAAEIPPALGELFGTDEALFVLPAAAPDALREAYRGLASRLGATRMVTDAKLAALPSGRPVWILGWENRYRAALARSILSEGVRFDAQGVRIDGQLRPRDGECAVLAARRSGSGNAALAWIGCDNLQAFAGLARKLPHYGKYGYLSFSGSEPDNVLKGQWRVSDSPRCRRSSRDNCSTVATTSSLSAAVSRTRTATSPVLDSTMPWSVFAEMTEDEVEAVWMFLQELEPVAGVVRMGNDCCF
jgi:hypothetical protein